MIHATRAGTGRCAAAGGVRRSWILISLQSLERSIAVLSSPGVVFAVKPGTHWEYMFASVYNQRYSVRDTSTTCANTTRHMDVIALQKTPISLCICSTLSSCHPSCNPARGDYSDTANTTSRTSRREISFSLWNVQGNIASRKQQQPAAARGRGYGGCTRCQRIRANTPYPGLQVGFYSLPCYIFFI